MTAGSVPNSDPVVFATPGTRYWQADYSGDSLNLPSTSTCGAEVETVNPAINLATSIVGTPDPVTAGNDVQYNGHGDEQRRGRGARRAGHRHAAGRRRPSCRRPRRRACIGTGPVTCQLGTHRRRRLGDGDDRRADGRRFRWNDGHRLRDHDSGRRARDRSPRTSRHRWPGRVTAFVPPGGSIDTGGNNPANLTPAEHRRRIADHDHATADRQHLLPGSVQRNRDVHLRLPRIQRPDAPDPPQAHVHRHERLTGLIDYATSTIYKVRDDATVGVAVPDCKDNPAWTPKQKLEAALRRLLRAGTQSGIANPAPCVDSRTIMKGSGNTYKVTFEILFLSDDGGFSRR